MYAYSNRCRRACGRVYEPPRQLKFRSLSTMYLYFPSSRRYNLKRKIAGLPPVTKEWYEARRAQLTAAASGPLQRVWFDPLSKKKFYSENTYLAFTKSKKYQDLVKQSGNPPPPAVVTVRRVDQEPASNSAQKTSTAAPGYAIKPAVRGGVVVEPSNEDGDQEEELGSDWETASEEEMATEDGNWEAWDVRQSLFDNHISASMEANLEYMWRKFGFYLPDSMYLIDPEAMLQYLGAKLKYGHIPLYESGNNPNAKQFASLHGVQRHMVDSGRCKPLYEGNEEEYSDFYDYDADDMEADGGTTKEDETSGALLAVMEGPYAPAVGGYELALATDRGGIKMLGSREFARYYRQRHRAGDLRESTAAARVVANYRRLAVPLLGDGSEGAEERRHQQRAVHKAERARLALSMRRNVNDNLPKNVPY